ncbi:mucin-16-like [Mixophyes fleayi]|uniref:mucin-16-like n=1 Tax=Mixophyes fleayi TaxID=3061075 RepID=UPI003F4E1395
MNKTTLNSSSPKCQIMRFTLANSKDTKVDAICTYTNQSQSLPFDTVAFYQELKNQTSNSTKLGIYTLDPNSVYVNGYNEMLPTTPTTSAVPTTPIAAFNILTVNFTVTNLPYTADMGTDNTSTFNSTQHIMSILLNSVMNKTTLNSSSPKCQIMRFTLANSKDTKVDAICTYTNQSQSLPFDTVAFYQELKNQTSNSTKLGMYTLDPNSVYVNGYNEMLPTTPTTSAAPTTPIAAFNILTVNFTVTNLPYTADMGTDNTSTFNSTQHIMSILLNSVMNKTTLNSSSPKCQIMRFTLANSKDTKVDAICTYTNQSQSLPFDTVAFYQELKNQTSNSTKLGIYTLDPNSVYVNGYNEMLPTTPTTSAAPTTPIAAFNILTVNFTVTNLPYTADMGTDNTSTFNSTQHIMSILLNSVMNKTTLNSSSPKCQIMRFTLANSKDTKVDAICTYTNQSQSLPFDTVAFYQELKNQTSNSTKLGIYTLDPNSVYVNGYNEMLPTTPTTSTAPTTPIAAVKMLTVNFTVTNLPYTTDMGTDNTSTFNSTQHIMSVLLNSVMNKTTLKSSSPTCQIIRFTLANSKDTKVDAICTYTNQSQSLPFNTVAFYQELKNQTSNSTKLGMYTLDPNSVYVNGYNEKLSTTPTTSTIPTTPIAAVKILTVNFTVTNLPYTADMGTDNTSTFNSTQRIMSVLLNSVMNKTTLKSSSPTCQIIRFTLANSKDTKVDAICTYTNQSLSLPFNTVAFYQELKNQTSNSTKLGMYTLDPNSVYVNGYNEKLSTTPTTSTIPTTPIAAVKILTVNFTLTNLPYTTDMGTNNTSTFNSTQRIITILLNSVMNKTTLKSSSPTCQVIRFTSSNSNTKVDAICNYVSNSSSSTIDKVVLYQEISNLTNSITKLGLYNMDPNSLYVNEYNKPAIVEPTIQVATIAPVQTTNYDVITLNFTITNLIYTSDLGIKNSAKYNTTTANVLFLVNNLMKNSSVSSKLSSCNVDSFVKSTGTGTKVNSICIIKKDVTGRQIDTVSLYNELSTMTSNITKLGIYDLDKNSLYVNGYNTVNTTPLTTTTTKSPANLITLSTFGPKSFLINFTITNLPYNSNLANKSSNQYKNVKGLLDQLMNNGFKNISIIKDKFINCTVTGFRKTPYSVDTTAESVCIFNVDLLARVFGEDDVKQLFLNISKDGTSLGNFTLLNSSIHVDIYRSDETTTVSNVISTTVSVITVAIPAASSADLGFAVNFTITNNSVPADPEKRRLLEEDIVQKMNALYQNSTLGKKFKFCKLAAMRNGSIIAACNCYFEDDPIVNKQSVGNEFFFGTTTGKLLGSTYTLKDFTVTELPRNKDLPFWAIILICLAALLALVLLFLVIFLLLFCLRRRKGSYDVQQSIYGTYFPHMDMRKLY